MGEAGAGSATAADDDDDGRLSPALHDPADVGLSPPVSPSLQPFEGGEGDGADGGGEDVLEEKDHLAMLEEQRARIIAAQRRAAEGKSLVDDAPAAPGMPFQCLQCV